MVIRVFRLLLASSAFIVIGSKAFPMVVLVQYTLGKFQDRKAARGG